MSLFCHRRLWWQHFLGQCGVLRPREGHLGGGDAYDVRAEWRGCGRHHGAVPERPVAMSEVRQRERCWFTCQSVCQPQFRVSAQSAARRAFQQKHMRLHRPNTYVGERPVFPHSWLETGELKHHMLPQNFRDHTCYKSFKKRISHALFWESSVDTPQ